MEEEFNEHDDFKEMAPEQMTEEQKVKEIYKLRRGNERLHKDLFRPRNENWRELGEGSKAFIVALGFLELFIYGVGFFVLLTLPQSQSQIAPLIALAGFFGWIGILPFF